LIGFDFSLPSRKNQTDMITEILEKKENVLMVVSLNDLKELFKEIYDEREAEKKAVADNEHDNELVGADDTAKILNVKKNTLWRWSKSGYLIPVKIGRKPFYKQADIDRIKGNK
jgi:predicted site-specific integrase-resolvase